MLKQVIEEIKKRPDLISFIEKKNEDVSDYFRNVLHCAFVPKQVIEFYENYNGADFSINSIYQLHKLKDLLDVFKREVKSFDIEYDEDKYIPISDDGMGGFYVFSSNKEDDKIYWIDTENVGNEWKIYDDLADFLDEMYKTALYIEEHDK